MNYFLLCLKIPVKYLKGWVCWTVLLCILGSGSPCLADWYNSPQQGRVGWYGYQPIGNFTKHKKKQSIKKKQAPLKNKTKKSKIIKWPSPEQLYHMGVKQVRYWTDKAFEQAMKTLRVKDVERWYSYYQIMVKKASDFTALWEWVYQTHPSYHLPGIYSGTLVPGGIKAYLDYKHRWITTMISLATPDKYALLVFLSHDEYSGVERHVIQMLKNKYPFLKVRYFYFPEDRKYFLRFHVEYTPQVWLLSRRKGLVPLIYGVEALDYTERVLAFTLALLNGKITLKQYQMLYSTLAQERNLSLNKAGK